MSSQSPIRVALYTRVSTDMQASKEEGSLETQEARLRSMIDSRRDPHEIRYVFREEGVSGKSLDRPELRRLMKQVEAGGIDLVMVTRVDRLSRSLIDFYTLHNAFEKNEVRFVSLNENFDTSSATGRAMLKLVLVFAELEREQTAERTRAAVQARAERGLWNGGPTPLGYALEPGGRLLVDEEEAEVVKIIFSQYLVLRSTGKLMQWLNEQGYRQKGRKRSGPKQKFTVGGVHGVLKNRVYLGELTHKGQSFKGQHLPIIDPDTFLRTKAIMANYTHQSVRKASERKYEYLLTGMLRCACGAALTTSAANGSGGRYHYYRCVAVQKKRGDGCLVRQKRAEVVEKAVLDIVRAAASDPELVNEAVEEANRIAREEVDPLRKLVVKLKKKLIKVEKEGEDLLMKLIAVGATDTETGKKLFHASEEQQKQIKTALSEAEGKLALREGEYLDSDLLVQAIQGFDAAFEYLDLGEKRELLGLMVKEIELHPDRVEVEFYEGGKTIGLLRKLKRRKNGGNGDGGNEDGGNGGDIGANEAGDLNVPAVPGGVPGQDAGAGQNETPGRVDQRFVSSKLWLPTPNRQRNNGNPVVVRLTAKRLDLDRPKSTKIPKVSRIQARENRAAQALEWAAMIDGIHIKTRADLARHVGVSRAWVTKVLGSSR